MKSKMNGRWRAGLVAIALVLSGVAIVAQRPGGPIPTGWAASNVKPVGYSDLNDRGGAFKLAIREVKGRWYLYMGHLYHRGWSIVDVTDPAAPKVEKFVPGPDNTWTIQMDLHGDTMITALSGFSEAWGSDPKKPNDEGFLIWDISDPVNPKKLGQWKGGGTHRNAYLGGRYVHAAADGGYAIVDIGDPTNPVEVSRWKEVGGIHGPPDVHGNLVYLPARSRMVIGDISDVKNPKLVGQLVFSPPYSGGIAVHTVLAVPDRKIAIVNSEAINEDCQEGVFHASIVDISDPAKPVLMSQLPRPMPPPGVPYTDFCGKGGRFGPHNINQHQHHPDVEKQGGLLYMTYFNAGLRVFDISNPRAPRETGYFIPPDPTKRYGPVPSKLVVQSEDVLVDRRGYAYITQKNQGLWIVRYTGPAVK
ncbi:MAG: hypothetical protein HY655_02930 [Acidobacteria bacterium]|nr:hypothetical protein [Acidobacteriota bacterium]